MLTVPKGDTAPAPNGPRILFEPQLVERVSDLELLRRDGTGDIWARRYRVACEEAYGLPQGGRREAFGRLAREAFQELGHAREVAACLGPLTRLHAKQRLITIALARSAGTEGADFRTQAALQAGPGDVSVAVLAERFVDGSLRPFLLVELEHLEEILDPRFGYDGSLVAVGASPIARRLIASRLQSLWDLRVRLHLSRRALIEVDRTEAEARLRQELRGLTEKGSSRLVEILSRPETLFPDLASAAVDPGAFLLLYGMEDEWRGAQPSSACPLCGFPTFDWATAPQIEVAAEAIAHDFPGFAAERGACRRCLEAYAGVSS